MRVGTSEVDPTVSAAGGEGGRMDDEHVSHATEHADLKRDIGPWLLFFFVSGTSWGPVFTPLSARSGPLWGARSGARSCAPSSLRSSPRPPTPSWLPNIRGRVGPPPN